MIEKIAVCTPTYVNPYENLALEYQLMKTVSKGACILSLWRNKRTVVIGRNQNMHKECRVEKLREDGGFLARRMSGGGAVFHDLGNLNFSFLAQDPDYNVEKQMSVVVKALETFGIHAELTGRNDVTVDGKKISGNAYLREKTARCHHGTLLVRVSSEDMMRYLTPDPGKLKSKGVKSVRSRVANLVEFVPDITVERLQEALIQAFEAVYEKKATPVTENDIDLGAVKQTADMLRSDAWLLGKEPQATVTTERTYFPWGSGELALTAEKGVVTDVALFTDALDETLSKTVEKALIGVNFDKDSLIKAVQSADIEPSVADGIQQLVCEVVK